MKKKDSMVGGLVMYAILVVVLVAPPVIGHFTLLNDKPAVSVHADASVTQ